MKRFVFLAAMALFWAMIGAVPDAAAYQTWSVDRATGNCADCHGNFRTTSYTSLKDGGLWSRGLHDDHRYTMLTGDCNTCHSTGSRFPVTLNSSVGGTGFDPIACVGCHGRDENGTVSAAGLRQSHFSAGVTLCTTCHGDANPATFTTVAESVNPPYYFTGDTAHPAKPTDACDGNGSESMFGPVGLDNDGDGLTDAADGDCAAANNPPVAADDAYTTDEDVQLVVAAPGVLGNDTDADGDPLTAVLQTGTANGTLALSADGSFTYTPNANFNGTDGFTYVANDGTDNSAAATVTITVNPVNDPPVADAGGPYGATVGTAVTFDGSGSSDLDGTIASYAWDFGDGTSGSGATPAHAYAAAGSFTVTLTVTDNGGLTDSATATAVISTVPNIPPVAADDAYSTDEDVQLVVAAPGVLGNDSDGDGDPLTASLQTGAANGTLALSGDGSFAYTPNANFNGTDSFTYVASDGADNSAPATVTITVNPVNDPPVADANNPYTGTVGVAVAFDGSGSSDVDGTIVSYDWSFGDGTNGSGANPTHAYAAAGSFTVTLTVTDDGGLTDTVSTTADITEAATPPNMAVAPLALDFGMVTVGGTDERTVTVMNDGGSPLDVLALTLTGSPAFGIVSAPGLPGPIDPGASVDIVLGYVPTAAVTDNGQLVIESDDPDGPSAAVTLTGQGKEMVAGEGLYNAWCAGCHGGPFDDVPASARKVPGARECLLVAAIRGNPGAEGDDSPFPDGVPAMQFLQSWLADDQLASIADYLNSQPVGGMKRYGTACAGCHGADARGGFVREDVRGADAEDIADAIWDEEAMRFLDCLPDSDIRQIADFLRGLHDDHEEEEERNRSDSWSSSSDGGSDRYSSWSYSRD